MAARQVARLPEWDAAELGHLTGIVSQSACSIIEFEQGCTPLDHDPRDHDLAFARPGFTLKHLAQQGLQHDNIHRLV